jgi:hypothetical protein
VRPIRRHFAIHLVDGHATSSRGRAVIASCHVQVAVGACHISRRSARGASKLTSLVSAERLVSRPPVRAAPSPIRRKVAKWAEQFSDIEWRENSFRTAVIEPAIQGVLAHYASEAAMIMPEKIKKPALEVQEQPSIPAEVAAHDMRASQALRKMKKALAGPMPFGAMSAHAAGAGGRRSQIPRCECFKASFIKAIRTNKRVIITAAHGGALQRIENRVMPRRRAPMTNTETQKTLRNVRFNACSSCSCVQLLRIPALPTAALTILRRLPRCVAS